LIDRKKKTLKENMARVPDMIFRKNSLNKPEIHCSLSKVPLSTA